MVKAGIFKLSPQRLYPRLYQHCAAASRVCKAFLPWQRWLLGILSVPKQGTAWKAGSVSSEQCIAVLCTSDCAFVFFLVSKSMEGWSDVGLMPHPSFFKASKLSWLSRECLKIWPGSLPKYCRTNGTNNNNAHRICVTLLYLCVCFHLNNISS